MKNACHFAVCLRRLRAEAKLTQAELAARAGVTLPTIGRMEIGLSQPSWEMVQKLARGLGVRTDAFVDPAILPPPPPPVPRKRGRPRLS